MACSASCLFLRDLGFLDKDIPDKAWILSDPPCRVLKKRSRDSLKERNVSSDCNLGSEAVSNASVSPFAKWYSEYFLPLHYRIGAEVTQHLCGNSVKRPGFGR